MPTLIDCSIFSLSGVKDYTFRPNNGPCAIIAPEKLAQIEYQHSGPCVTLLLLYRTKTRVYIVKVSISIRALAPGISNRKNGEFLFEVVKIDTYCKLPSHKSFMIKKKLAKKQRQNRPIPYWIRMRTDNTIRVVENASKMGSTPFVRF
ncbi:hypothetical protein H5410_059177 [Solanum commersonii]|uniref:60S ribosomal protein L39 n=1 Tax=Solanum commersonii TaxID=4109 RepID=A0A9J5W1M4_SOLCO|nr:hypothetical protein H5410_059177 [Solanum commersonii]